MMYPYFGNVTLIPKTPMKYLVYIIENIITPFCTGKIVLEFRMYFKIVMLGVSWFFITIQLRFPIDKRNSST